MSQHFGGGAAPFLIAGPCVLESDALNLRVGEALAELGARLGLHVVFKASYDKANRSRLKGLRGPGLERGLAALAKVRSATGLAVLTDVHEAAQVPGADIESLAERSRIDRWYIDRLANIVRLEVEGDVRELRRSGFSDAMITALRGELSRQSPGIRSAVG